MKIMSYDQARSKKSGEKNFIAELIGAKPQLADPFRFYRKAARFIDAIRGLALRIGPEQTSYPPEVVDEVCRRFSSILELPEGALFPLKQAMELREIDFTRLPMGETPAFSLPYAEDDLSMLLYLLSKPWFLRLKNTYRLDGRRWDENRCPVCNAPPMISWIEDDDRRATICPFCRTAGYVNRRGCSICLAEDARNQGLLVFEGERGFMLNTCDLCRSYTKTVKKEIASFFSPEIADLMTLQLDVITQKQGYMRRTPNAIGLRKITMHG